MAGVNLPKTDAQLERIAIAFKEALQSAMRRKRKRTSLRVKWARNGKGWKPLSVKKGSYTSNIVASGYLMNNTKVVSKGPMDYSVTMPSYAKFLIEGRKKGKGIPVRNMASWIQQKRIKPKNEQGQFKKMDKRTLGFLMNRKIKYFGIEGYDFVAPERKDILRRYNSALSKAMNQDIMNIITKGLR